MVLVDPSIADDSVLETGMTLTCFAKRAKEIPDPQKGDVVIMRDVSVSKASSQSTGFCSNYLGLQVESPHGFKLIATCPSYKLWSWTIFHPAHGTLRSGGTALPPESPAPALTPAESQYCVRLADWWLERTKELEQKGGDTGVVVHQISVSDAPYNNLVLGRVHRLLKDASPHAPPSGYFDCTIEVSNLHSHDVFQFTTRAGFIRTPE